MKKQLIAALSALLVAGSAFALCSCGGGNDTPDDAGTPPTDQTHTDPSDITDSSTPALKTITGVTLEGDTHVYDGQAHPLAISGTLPSGAVVTYSTNNNSVDAGVYDVTAEVTCEGYNKLTLNAKLTISKLTITGVTLEDDTHVYDGQAHPLAISGTLPSGASVTYSANNNSVDAGVYDVTATVTCANYETLTLPAKLTISKATMAGLSFSGETFYYDATPHTIALVGQTPQGSTVTYTCAENPAVENSATETGTYTITVNVTNKNFETFSATATLKITASEKERYIYSQNGKLYFANALDGDKLYSYTAADGVKKISGDVPYSFTEMGGELYFRSYAPFSSSVKTVTESAGSAAASTVISVKGEYLCTDGSTLYYAVNGLTQDKSGIYKINLSGSEPAAVLLSEGKAKYLAYYGGNLYFADGANGYKLSKISVSGGARTLVLDEKITCLTQSGGSLYYTVDNLLGNYIEKFTISSSQRRKLTSDAGANLTVIGGKLYYINVDALNSYLFGKGIYSVNTSPVADNSLPGSKVIGEDNESYSSLTKTDGNTLAYYRVSDQMLCVSDTDGGNVKEILDGFVAPETVPISTGSKTAAYGKTLYFLDLYNDKALYSYDAQTKAISRITSNKVSDFAILGEALYYNAVSFGVNNDLYKIDLKMGGEAVKISTNDCNNIVTDGTKIFYIKENAGGVATAITEIDGDGNETDIFTKGVNNLIYYKNYLYFEYKDAVHRMPTENYTVDVTENVTHADVSHVGTFIIDDDVIYFRELYGFGWGFKRLSRMNIDGTDYKVMITEGTDPLEICVYGNKVYYYNDVLSGASGIYCIDKTAVNASTATLVLDYDQTYYAAEFTIIDGKIYFINFRAQLGDSHLYCLDIATKAVEKIV